MSSPPNGRALALPVGWGSTRESALSLPVVEVRSPSDEELMSSLQTKDSKALELLFDRYSRLVFGIALRILNDHSEAEEVVQEAFLYIYQKALLFDPLKGSPNRVQPGPRPEGASVAPGFLFWYRYRFPGRYFTGA